MLSIDLRGKRALVAGVADDGGYGFAIAKALAEGGATVCTGTWPPALNIFLNLIERGKIDESRRLSDGSLLTFEKIYPLDAAFDTLTDAPDDIRTNKRYAENTPLPEPTRAEEVGAAVAFLASDLARGITGSTIYVDKGYHVMGMAAT